MENNKCTVIDLLSGIDVRRAMTDHRRGLFDIQYGKSISSFLKHSTIVKVLYVIAPPAIASQHLPGVASEICTSWAMKVS